MQYTNTTAAHSCCKITCTECCRQHLRRQIRVSQLPTLCHKLLIKCLALLTNMWPYSSIQVTQQAAETQRWHSQYQDYFEH